MASERAEAPPVVVTRLAGKADPPTLVVGFMTADSPGRERRYVIRLRPGVAVSPAGTPCRGAGGSASVSHRPPAATGQMRARARGACALSSQALGSTAVFDALLKKYPRFFGSPSRSEAVSAWLRGARWRARRH